MEAKLLFSSQKPPLFTYKPLFVSYRSPFVDKPQSFLKSNLSLATIHTEKSEFWGSSLVSNQKTGFVEKWRKSHVRFAPIRAVVKRRKELPFDNVIQREKKLKLVMKIRKILLSQPDKIMTLRQLGRFRRELGLTKKRRFIALLRKFPAVFEIVEDGAYSLKFKLTPEAEGLYLEELRISNELEDLLVVKLRKLLMMSEEKRILLEKIAHLKTDFGLPFEFRDTICNRYPQYFRVVPTGRGPALELTHWDPELAISAAELVEEDNRVKELEEKNLIIDRPLKFNRVKLPKGLNLSKGEMRRICEFRDMPFISPYSDFSGFRSGTREKEKHACAVIHEILSLTIEKRTLVDHLTHFREEFRFSQQLRGMVIRHPDMFYVSLKGTRNSVFLREAYRDGQLIDKDRMLIIKEKLRSLVSVPKFPRRGVPRIESDAADRTDEQEDESGEEGEEWSDIDNYVTGEDDDDDDEDGDDWSDEDDDLPPDFNDDDDRTVKIGLSQSTNKAGSTVTKEEKVLVPMYPDGRPRDRW
ncbi:protein ROOT PRIMORDIUM DEFECTIVE 1-like [Tripterygium wilfordii]|uniref:Protein ROOT PRIMORDIUM DEFECTIVE 1-like n=1 Tax=Tripterygium wilfordii TaxID=458696 RepID=A0A7J7CGE6_TRIWF|nr:protein WHAT'S THIS FACTOR 1 homolog, chloroplastic [Tripterygium wilfordii]KAF5733117.1 protein ROOT PRIMORDIUM DEFECTIVE 1-like [Tripterygium wilfordii]